MKIVVLSIIVILLLSGCANNIGTSSSNSKIETIIEADGFMYAAQMESDARIPIHGSIKITNNKFTFVPDKTVTIQKNAQAHLFTIPITSMKKIKILERQLNNQNLFEFYLGKNTHMIFSSLKSEEIVETILQIKN